MMTDEYEQIARRDRQPKQNTNNKDWDLDRDKVSQRKTAKRAAKLAKKTQKRKAA